MTKELLRGLDISRLSPRSRAILIRINDPVLDGWKETELASRLGRTPSWVSERLSELRTEIYLQNGLFPPLTDAEEASLRDSIRHNGVMLPVLVDEDLALIDGRNRLRITHELHLRCPFWILYDLSSEEKREISIALNAARRQLNRQQKRKLIEHELMHDAGRSDRRIAAICGVHHSTVGSVRVEITASVARWRELELPLTDAPIILAAPPTDDVAETATPVWQRGTRPDAAPPVRIDSIGRSQPARPRAAPQPKAIAALACPCCNAQLTLIRTAGTYTLEHPTIDAA